MKPSGDTPPWTAVVARNPYRVLGLPGDAVWADIAARGARLLTSADPAGETTPWDIPWFAPLARGPAEVERAMARLSDPHQRLRERLFWFHEAVAEMAVYELLPANLRNALEGWGSTSQPLARHDAAVVALLKALTLDPRVEDAATWRRLFQEWRAATDQEEYWMAVLRLEMSGGFEPAASLADLRDLREAAPGAITAPLLEIARLSVLEEDLARAARALAILREALPEETFGRECGDLASHVWGRFDADWGEAPAAAPPAAPSTPEPASAGDDGPRPRKVALETQNPNLWDLQTSTPSPEAASPAEAADDLPDPADPDEAETIPETPHAPAEPPPVEKPRTEPVRAKDSTPREVPAATAPAAADPVPDGQDPETDREAEPGPDVAPDPRRDSTRPPDSRRAASRGPLPVAWMAGIAASVAVAVAIASLALGGVGSDRPEESDRVAGVAIEERIERSAGEIAEAVVERHELDQEIALVERAIEGYQVLVEDYERRAGYRLAVDHEAWRRVALARNRAVARRESLLQARLDIVARRDSLIQVDGGLVAAYNELRRSGSDAGVSEREPSP